MAKKGPDPRQKNGHRRRQLRERLRRNGDPCAICGRPIDYGLPSGDPWSFEIDEIVPVARWKEFGYASPTACALDPGNVQAAHRICNERKGDCTARYAPPPKAPTTSRVW